MPQTSLLNEKIKIKRTIIKKKKNAQWRETGRKRSLFGFEKKMKRLWNLAIIGFLVQIGCTWLSNDIPQTPHLTKVHINRWNNCI